MTSKEAFRHIIDDDFNMVITTIPSQLAYNGLTKKDMIEIIEKDLEVLEILKKHYKSDGWSNGGVIEFWKMNNKELRAIKWWLER